MPRFRIVAHVTAPRPIVRLIPMRLRAEAKKLAKRGIPVSIDSIDIREEKEGGD